MECGPYVGVVESNKDPEKLGRVKVSVAHVYGVPDSELGGISVNDLPWAIPAGLPAGGSALSGGIDWLPEPGDQVLVFFLDGEPEKPVWMWMMQTIDQSKGYKIHNYGVGTPVGTPERAGLIRYGHTFEINSGSMFMSTKSGYQFSMLNGNPLLLNGQIKISTPRGQMWELDDQNQLLTIYVIGDCQQISGGQWRSVSSSIDFVTTIGNIDLVCGQSVTEKIALNRTTAALGKGEETYGTTYDLTAGLSATITSGQVMRLNAATNFAIASPFMRFGAEATEPAVLGERLVQLWNVFLLWAAGHTHSNGNDGSPTGPPIISPQREVSGLLSSILSKTITIQD
jgi:hypothetical protein